MVKHIKNLVFDLDNTLYPGSMEIEPKFMERMLTFYEDKLGMMVTEDILNKWKAEQGSELAAAMSKGADPDFFVDFVCDVDCSKIKYNDRLKEQLQALSKHNKIIYTNSSRRHAKDVLGRLDLSDVLKNIFTVKEGNLVAKPLVPSFKKFIDFNNINSNETAMFEDSIKNLKAAKDFGMTTILISEEEIVKPAHCDYMFKNINEALDIFLES